MPAFSDAAFRLSNMISIRKREAEGERPHGFAHAFESPPVPDARGHGYRRRIRDERRPRRARSDLGVAGRASDQGPSRLRTAVPLRQHDPPSSQAPTAITDTALTTPLQDLDGIITPSGLHFLMDHVNGIPDIDPKTHRLLIHGMVDRPLTFTMDELRRFPSVSRVYFLECNANSRPSRGPNKESVQLIHGRTSCSEWTGVLLPVLLKECGVQKRASWIVAEGGRVEQVHDEHPAREGDGRHPGGLRAERRARASASRLSAPTRRPRLGGDSIRQVAHPHRRRRSAVHGVARKRQQRGYGPEREGPLVPVRARSEVGHHAAVGRSAVEPGILRDYRSGVDGRRRRAKGRGLDRRRTDLQERGTSAAGASVCAHAVPLSVDVERRRGGAPVALHRRAR